MANSNSLPRSSVKYRIVIPKISFNNRLAAPQVCAEEVVHTSLDVKNEPKLISRIDESRSAAVEPATNTSPSIGVGPQTTSFICHVLNEHPRAKEPNQILKDPWRCMFCSLWFDGPRRLSYHVKYNHKRVVEMKAVLIRPSSSNEERSSVKCEICGQEILNSDLLDKHIAETHPEKFSENSVGDPRCCPLCNKKCNGEKGLRKHLHNSHGPEIARRLEPLVSAPKYVPEESPWLCDALLTNHRSAKLVLSAACEAGTKGNSVRAEFHAKDESDKLLDAIDAGTLSDAPDRSKAEELATNRYKKARISDIETEGCCDPESKTTYCVDCKLDLEQRELYWRHFVLRHKRTQCPTCLLWVNGQVGLEVHDDDVHPGTF